MDWRAPRRRPPGAGALRRLDVLVFLHRNGEEKRGSFPGLGLYPDAASIGGDDFLTGSQADTASLILGPVQPLERLENILRIFRIDSAPVIAHAEEIGR